MPLTPTTPPFGTFPMASATKPPTAATRGSKPLTNEAWCKKIHSHRSKPRTQIGIEERIHGAKSEIWKCRAAFQSGALAKRLERSDRGRFAGRSRSRLCCAAHESRQQGT